jgi:hypothetical protein
MESDSAGPKVVILNTLGGALHHYALEMQHQVETAGANCVTVSIPEPSSSTGGARQWLSSYVRHLRSLRSEIKRGTASHVIVTWPLVGYLDFVIIRMFLGSASSLVIHDPVPLVKSRGYGRVSQLLATLFMGRCTLVVHSGQAHEAIGSAVLRRRAVDLPLPMLPPTVGRRSARERPIVRTLGQFKPDRDLDALRAVAAGMPDADLQIVGRRWPAVQGWSVRDEFVPERELAELIDTADVVVIPYRRFFQSNIAVRCLESGTPVVGPSGTSLETMLRAAPGLLVSDDEWLAAVVAAVGPNGMQLAAAAGADSYEQCTTSWSGWLRGLEAISP